METAAATTTTTETPAPAKSAEDKLHERAAALLEKANAPAVVETPAPKPAEVEMDAATLKRLTDESEKRRAAEKRAQTAEAKLKESEAGQSDVATMREAKKLWAAGDHMGAMAKLTEKEDPSAEIEALMNEWLKKPAPGEKPLLTAEEIEAIKAESEASKKDREAREAREKAEADRKNAESFSTAMRDMKDEAGAPRWPLAAAPENAAEAATVALEKANKRLLKLGVKEVTKELAEHLFELAYAEIEANLAKDAKKPAETPAEPAPAARAATVPRAGVTPATKSTYPRTPEGARQKLFDTVREKLAAKAS